MPLEITCVNKSDISGAVRITRVGGFHAGCRWSLGVSQLILQIETEKESYFICHQKNPIAVTVTTNSLGNRYIEALTAGGNRNALLDLPQCII